MRKNHYFFAVKLPKEIKIFIKNWIQQNKERYEFEKWVHYEDYHITLAFLGFVDETKRKELIEVVSQIVTNEYALALTLSNIGTFGLTESPRIFWMGIDESIKLNNIQKKIYNECSKVGISLDKRPFHPHITLARKWIGQVPYQLKSGDIKILNQTFMVKEIVLYETHLDQTPKYKEYARFPLA